MDRLSLALIKAAMVIANCTDDSLELRNRPDCYAGLARLRWQIAYRRLPRTEVEEIFMLLRVAQDACERGDLRHANAIYMAIRDLADLP